MVAMGVAIGVVATVVAMTISTLEDTTTLMGLCSMDQDQASVAMAMFYLASKGHQRHKGLPGLSRGRGTKGAQGCSAQHTGVSGILECQARANKEHRKGALGSCVGL